METESLDRLIERVHSDLKRAYVARVARLNHIYGVRDTALKLAKIHGVDKKKVLLVSYLHDLTKHEELSVHERLVLSTYDTMILETFPPTLWHAYSAAALAKTTYAIDDDDVLKAIESHTIGRADMSMLESILFISDYIEPHRLYPDCVTAREMAFIDLDAAIHYAIEQSIRYHEKRANPVPRTAYEAKDHYERKMK